MTREEAINILTYYDDEVWKRYHKITPEMFSQAVNMACEALNPWISVKDELPKERQIVFIGNSSQHWVIKGKRIGDKFYDLSHLPRLEEATHWMPIPPLNEEE